MHALDEVRRYAAAARVARGIRSLPPSLSSADAFAITQRPPWFGGDSLHADQKPDEIVWLLERLREEMPRTVLEIGMANGGTLFLWSRIAAPDALLVGVDVQAMVGRLGKHSPWSLVRRSFARERQRVELVDGADSHDERTLECVRALLAGRTVDFLFIDGDHRYDSVARDFELYAPLVRPGGLIGLHDVAAAASPDTEGTARFWRELKMRGTTEERVAGGAPGYGIGVYRVPTAA